MLQFYKCLFFVIFVWFYIVYKVTFYLHFADKAVKYKDSLGDSPKVLFEKKQQCPPLKHMNEVVCLMLTEYKVHMT